MTHVGGRLREVLVGAGYDIVFREGTWVECRVWSDAESWVGRGSDHDDAFREATRKMFPSLSARRLLDRALSPTSPVVQPAVDGERSSAPAPLAVAAFVSTPAAAPIVEAAPATRALAAPKAEPARSESEGPAAPAPPDPVTASISRLDRLMAAIDACQPVLACLAPERQRLWLLIWICRARAEQERHQTSQEIHRGVARIARRLGEMAKTFWPGSVRALQHTAEPGEVGSGRRQADTTPSTWTEAAVAAENALDQHLEQAGRAGLDEDGWADSAMLDPRPEKPDALLAEVASEIEGGLKEATKDRLVHLGRLLRWTRRGVADPVRWGAAMGRLREIGIDRSDALREICESRYKPKQPWARTLTGEAPRAQGAPRAPDAPAPVADLPPRENGPEALAAWLVGAFVLDTPALAAVVAARKEEICALDDAALPSSDRRLRRRFRELKRRLAEGEPAPDTTAPASDEATADTSSAEDEPSGATRMLEGLAAVVRPHTEGRRALFVSNRHDPPLQAKLEEILGLSITWCEATPRRVQSHADRVARGAFDLVLSATGFQIHAVDIALAKAAKTSSVPLVRVDRGRPLACVRAIAREFGVGEH